MINLIPAYGRRYETEESALADWYGGKDFRIYRGPYTSVRDTALLLENFEEIVIYYDYPFKMETTIIQE